MRIQQCVCYPMLKPADMSLDTLFRASADMGYQAVEIWERDATFPEVLATAKKYGLAVASMNASSVNGDGSFMAQDVCARSTPDRHWSMCSAVFTTTPQVPSSSACTASMS